jgi:hypothetical protein
MVAKSCEKLLCKFVCEECDYVTSKKSSYDKHLTTLKHVNTINTTKYNDISNFIKEKEYICACGNKYKHNASLFNHKKKCKKTDDVKNKDEGISGASISGASISGTNISETGISDASSNIIQLLIKESSEFKNIILEIVKSNTDIQKQMLDVCKNSNSVVNTNSHNTNTTTNNKIFNLQVFLNEECKDAMNMSDFINSIEIKTSDLVNIGKLGYVEGVSNIIIKQLNDTEVNKRPVHCSDAKRETLYVKEENKWEKETQETKQMLTAVRGVNKKNYTLLANWKETHPKCTDSKSNQSDEYMKVVSKVMDGDEENINKVIKRVAKEVVIEKEK